MSVPVLAAHCLKELSNYRRGEPCTDVYGVELLRCATVKGDQEAWTGVQHCLSEVVRGWLRRHPSREAACRLENEENYVAQAFEHFRQASSRNRSHVGRSVEHCGTCVPVCTGPFWTPCGPTRGQEKSRCRSQAR
jgi:hypothetical protein